ncbi:MAG: hypothetical protein WB660_14360 [Candidatus Sulfotelmatobacter sp.]
MPSQEVRKRADELLDKARHLSDIRAQNASPFPLEATFSFADGLETVKGTYTEVSNSQWRREIAVGDLLYIEVGGPARIWSLDKSETSLRKRSKWST